jgi:uncharacterized membrane protein YgcG
VFITWITWGWRILIGIEYGGAKIYLTFIIGNDMKHSLWLALWLALTLALLSLAGAAQAQDKTLYWQRYDVNLNIQPNSDILIEEIQEITFTSGTFQFGFAAIPLDRAEAITEVRVSELINSQERVYQPNSTANYGFTTAETEGNLEITWYFPPTSNSTHTYVLRYRVIGGLRMYPEGDQLWWKAIPPDHNFPIQSSRVIVTLPQTFPKEQLKAESYGAPATISYTDRGQVVFTAQNIPPDEELEVRVQFPPGAVQGQPPAWQTMDDLRRQWGPVVGVLFGFLGLVAVIGGPLALYLLWYKRGRDLPVSLAPEYVTEPPGDLPAGLVGTLVDEKADLPDIIATITDLGRRGALRLEEQQKEGFMGLGSGREYIFHLVDESQATRPFEKKLLEGIFRGQTEQRMADLRAKFYTYVPQLQQQLYDEVVQAGYYPANPNSTRRKWMGLGIAALLGSIVVSCGLLCALGDFSPLAACPGLGLVATSIGLIILGQHMPRKTSRGAEETAKWLAFKRYLQTIEQHGDLTTVKDKFEEFLPYAIAFGLERSLINKFTRLDTPAPSWWGPVYLPRPGYGYPRPIGGGPAPAGGLPGPLAGEPKGAPSLNDMSQGVGASLASMSAGLGAMLNSASSTLTSTPAPKSSGSGGWSSGGWSGGGGFGGGGGGGSRGFG